MHEPVWMIAVLHLTADLLAAGIIYFAIERKIAAKEERDRRRENHNLINAMLLAQFPPLIERVHRCQRQAFDAAMLLHGATPPRHPLVIASHARHIANEQLDVRDTLKCMSVDNLGVTTVAELANAVAYAAITLARGDVVGQDVMDVMTEQYKVLGELYDDEFGGELHLQRIRATVEETPAQFGTYSALAIADQMALESRLCETLGHLAVLYNEFVLKDFRANVRRIQHAAQ